LDVKIILEALPPDPLVTVIIDNYNYGRFLAEAIDSVLAQTYLNYELLVVDDGSTDHSRMVIESYGDRFRTIFQSNRGQGGAFRTGLAEARGDIICFLDADDYFHPDKLTQVVAAFQHHPNWVQVAHCWTTINTEGNITGSSASDVLSQGDVSGLLLRWGKYASGITSALAYRREVLQQIEITHSRCIIDSFLNATVPFYGTVGSLNQPLMFYRIHGHNLYARNYDVVYLMQQRQLIADYINAAAAQVGLASRFDLERDADYRAYEAIARQGISRMEALDIICLSLQESWAIGRSPKDTVIRLGNRALCALFPRQGVQVLRYGLRGYLRWKGSSQSV
jgi:glycosyltransferase involved in cell wall biosynthesis